MKKFIKPLIIILVILIIILILFCIDYNRVKNNKTPIFCIKGEMAQDGGTIEYFGIGYKIIAFNKLNGYTETKIGPLTMKADDFLNEFTYPKSISDLPKELLIDDMIKENYVVISNSENKIYNKDILDKFIENATNNIDDYIQIISYNINKIPTVYAIQYYASNYILVKDSTRTNLPSAGITSNYNLPAKYYSISLIKSTINNTITLSLIPINTSDTSYNLVEILNYKLDSEIINKN